MTNAQRLGLIGVLTLIATSSARTSHADTVYGTWTGVESYQIEEIVGGDIYPLNSGSDLPATLEMTYDTDSGLVTVDINPGGGIAEGFISGFGAPFGPTSASGSLDGVANYFLTYESILPSGAIDTTNGNASADITAITYFMGPPGGILIDSYQFQTLGIPEPSSIVQAALAVLMIVVNAWMRGFRPRLRRILS